MNIKDVAENMKALPDDEALGLAIGAGRSITRVSKQLKRASYAIRDQVTQRDLWKKNDISKDKAEEEHQEVNSLADAEKKDRDDRTTARNTVADKWGADNFKRLTLLKGLPDTSGTWKAIRKLGNQCQDYQQMACRVIDQIHIRLTLRKGQGVTGKPKFKAIDFTRAAEAAKVVTAYVTIQEVQARPDLEEMAKQMGLDLILLPSKPSNLLEDKAGGTQSVHEEVRPHGSDLPRMPTSSSSDTPLAETTSPVLTNIDDEVRPHGSNRPEGLEQPTTSLASQGRQPDNELHRAVSQDQPGVPAISVNTSAEQLQPNVPREQHQPEMAEDHWVFPTRPVGMNLNEWERALRKIILLRLQTAVADGNKDPTLVKIVAEHEAAHALINCPVVH